MKVKLSNPGVAKPLDLRHLEAWLGRELPLSYREFVGEHDGAEPETNIFRIDDGNDSGVSGFIPVRKIEEEARHIENLGAGAFPVAWADGGNYVLVDLEKDGAVLFWDHEDPEHATVLAGDFATFLSVIEPFDVNDIVLKPGQVKSAWIDPDLLNELPE